MSVYIGIDPGATGAIAKVSTEGWAEVEKMPKFDVEFGWHLANLIPSSFTTRKGVIYLEEVHGRGGWGANANYSFGLASGYVLGGLSAWGIEPVMVTPQKWQKALDAKPYRGEAQKKRRSKEQGSKTILRGKSTGKWIQMARMRSLNSIKF